MLQSVDALRDHADEIALAGAEHLGDGLHPAGHLGLQAGHLGDLVVHLPRPLGRHGRFQLPLAPGAHQQHGQEQEKAEADRRPVPIDDLTPGEAMK